MPGRDRIGPYEILEPLGAGGMGEVFRGRDPRIGREVAVKLLPSSSLANESLLRRFEQESRAAGSLNHPNLITIYDAGSDDGVPYIVMELLDGKTLRERIGQGQDGPGVPAIPQRKAIDYAIQIATGLAAAHEKGIVHRDLKPENIFITDDGRVKILDFGLAKLRPSAEDTKTQSRTEQRGGTLPGTVVGSPGYMSPEQVRGEELDHRTDIFSFGSILYEMLSGRRAFRGQSAADTMSAILREDPPELSFPRLAVNPALTHIVRHCLEKNPNERFQSARDLAFDLQTVASSSTSGSIAKSAAPRPWLLLGVAVLAAIAAAVAGWFALRQPRAHRGTPKVIGASPLTFRSGIESFPSIAPDGKTFVYAGNARGNNDIYLQRIDGQNAINLTADSPVDDTQPAFSADGSLIAFRSERDGGGIFVMGATGESVRRIADFGFNPSWSPDGKEIVCSTERIDFAPQSRGTYSKLWIIDVTSGQKRLLTDKARGAQPVWSPHGQRIAFWGMDEARAQRDLFTIDPRSANGEPRLLLEDAALDWNPMWSPDGRYLYFGSERGGTMNLWRIAIDESSGERRGEPESLALPARFAGHFSIAGNGRLILFSALETAGALRRAPLSDTTRTATILGGSIVIFSFEVSPDAQWVAFSNSGGQEDLFIGRIDTGEIRQITNDGHRDRGPSWTPDGKQILFYSNRGGNFDIWRINVDGSGLTRLTQGVAPSIWFPRMSPDGAMIAVTGFETSIIIPVSNEIVRKGEVIPSPAGASTLFLPTSWAPDSRRIAGLIIDPAVRFVNGAIATYDVKARTFTKLRDRGVAVRWAPDGRSVVMLDRDRIIVMDLATSRTREYPFRMTTNFLVSGRSNPFWTDGKEILWVDQLNEADVWQVTLGEDETRR